MARRTRRGRRGEGTVYPSDGRWIARFPLGVVDGKRLSKRVRCATEDEADDELERLRRIKRRVYVRIVWRHLPERLV